MNCKSCTKVDSSCFKTISEYLSGQINELIILIGNLFSRKVRKKEMIQKKNSPYFS